MMKMSFQILSIIGLILQPTYPLRRAETSQVRTSAKYVSRIPLICQIIHSLTLCFLLQMLQPRATTTTIVTTTPHLSFPSQLTPTLFSQKCNTTDINPFTTAKAALRLCLLPHHIHIPTKYFHNPTIMLPPTALIIMNRYSIAPLTSSTQRPPPAKITAFMTIQMIINDNTQISSTASN